MTVQNTSFGDLLRLVDDDFTRIADTGYKRGALYYNVKINQNKTDVLARKARVPGNNAIKTTFLIHTAHEGDSYSTLYMSEIDIIGILAQMDDLLYNHIKQYLVAAYRGKTDPKAHHVQFERGDLAEGIEGALLSANHDILTFPIYGSDPDISTPFGFSISFQSFCDAFSLILSSENEEKLKVITAKYCIFTTLLRSSSHNAYIPARLQHVKTLKDVEDIYAGKTSKETRKYDAGVFTPKESGKYFTGIS